MTRSMNSRFKERINADIREEESFNVDVVGFVVFGFTQ